MGGDKKEIKITIAPNGMKIRSTGESNNGAETMVENALDDTRQLVKQLFTGEVAKAYFGELKGKKLQEREEILKKYQEAVYKLLKEKEGEKPDEKAAKEIVFDFLRKKKATALVKAMEEVLGAKEKEEQEKRLKEEEARKATLREGRRANEEASKRKKEEFKDKFKELLGEPKNNGDYYSEGATYYKDGEEFRILLVKNRTDEARVVILNVKTKRYFGAGRGREKIEFKLDEAFAKELKKNGFDKEQKKEKPVAEKIEEKKEQATPEVGDGKITSVEQFVKKHYPAGTIFENQSQRIFLRIGNLRENKDGKEVDVFVDVIRKNKKGEKEEEHKWMSESEFDKFFNDEKQTWDVYKNRTEYNEKRIGKPVEETGEEKKPEVVTKEDKLAEEGKKAEEAEKQEGNKENAQINKTIDTKEAKGDTKESEKETSREEGKEIADEAREELEKQADEQKEILSAANKPDEAENPNEEEGSLGIDPENVIEMKPNAKGIYEYGEKKDLRSKVDEIYKDLSELQKKFNSARKNYNLWKRIARRIKGAEIEDEEFFDEEELRRAKKEKKKEERIAVKEEYERAERQLEVGKMKYKEVYEEYVLAEYDKHKVGGVPAKGIGAFMMGEKVVDVGKEKVDEKGNKEKINEKVSLIEYYNARLLELNNLQIENTDSKTKTTFKKAWEYYKNMPKWQKIALGAVLAGGLAMTTGGIVAGVAYGGYRAGKGMASAGMTSVLGTFFTKNMEKFKAEKWKRSEEKIEGNYRWGQSILAEIDRYNNEIRKKQRNDSLKILGIAGAVGGSASFFNSEILDLVGAGQVKIIDAEALNKAGSFKVEMSSSAVDQDKLTDFQMGGKQEDVEDVIDIKKAETLGGSKEEIATNAAKMVKGEDFSEIPEEEEWKSHYKNKENLFGEAGQESDVKGAEMPPESEREFLKTEPEKWKDHYGEKSASEFWQGTDEAVENAGTALADDEAIAINPEVGEFKMVEPLGEKGTVWGASSRLDYFEGNQTKVANAILKFKKEVMKNLMGEQGMSQAEADDFVEWRFKHMQPSDEVAIDKNGSISIKGFDSKKILRFFKNAK